MNINCHTPSSPNTHTHTLDVSSSPELRTVNYFVRLVLLFVI